MSSGFRIFGKFAIKNLEQNKVLHCCPPMEPTRLGLESKDKITTGSNLYLLVET
jgi:hypothetical protein